MLTRTAIALTLLIGAQPAAAAPPDVKALYPAGGQRGQTVTFAVTGNVGTPPAQVWSSRPEIKVEPAADAGKYTVAIPADAEPGIVRLRWHNADGASPLKSFVIGTIPEFAEKEPNNDLANATAVEMPRSVVNGVLDKNGEIDVFAVNLKKGDTLVAALDANRSLGSPMDGVLQIVSPKGFVLEQNDDGPGYDPLAACTAETDGTHYVRVFAFPTEPNTNVTFHGGPDYVYRLTLTTGPWVTHAAPFAVQRGASTSLKLFGWNIPADKAELALPASEATDAWLLRDDLANAVLLPVVAHPTVVEAEPSSAEAPVKVAVPVIITGTIESRRDADTFEFAATKGQRLSIRSEARTLGSLLDSAIRISDAMGKVLAENDDAQRGTPDAELTWAVPADGTYRAEIRDLYDDGGPRYFYRLTIEQDQPDVELTLAADQFTLPADKPLEVPVTITRKGGFKEELDIAIEGLPDSLSCSTVQSTMSNDTAKAVKLVIERKTGEDVAMPPAGLPFRVTARAAMPAGFERRAEAPLAPMSRVRTSDFWLTIPAKK